MQGLLAERFDLRFHRGTAVHSGTEEMAIFTYASGKPLWRMTWQKPDSGMDESFPGIFNATEVD